MATDWKASLVVGKQELPPRICVYGPHGIGKSTFAAAFPKPIFISTEDGLSSLDVTSFPKAGKVDDVVGAIRTLIKEDHDFKTVCIDSVDWLVEPLISEDIKGKYDDKERGYGKEQVYIAESFREILEGLNVLRKKRSMNIVMIAHSAITRFEDPRTEPYDRYQPKLPNRCNALMQEWVDILAFVNYKVLIKKADVGFNNTVSRGITTGERLLHFVENPAFLAKNRYACPDTVELSYAELKKLVPISE
jgi:hypothetical protein